MDGAQASLLILDRRKPKVKNKGPSSRRAPGLISLQNKLRVEASQAVMPGGAARGADLGGSSKNSNENFEGRRDEGFRGNSNWPRVSRS